MTRMQKQSQKICMIGDQNILKYIDSCMDLSNFKSILQNNKQDLKKRIQMEKTYIENEYYDFISK